MHGAYVDRKNWKAVSLRTRSFGGSLLNPNWVWLVLPVAGRWGVAWAGFLVAPSELPVARMVGVSQWEQSAAAYCGGNDLNLWNGEAAGTEPWPERQMPEQVSGPPMSSKGGGQSPLAVIKRLIKWRGDGLLLRYHQNSTYKVHSSINWFHFSENHCGLVIKAFTIDLS